MFGGALARWSVFAASVACTLTSARAQTTGNSAVVPRQPWPLQTIEVMAARPNECAAFGPRSPDHVNVSWGQVKALDTRQRCARLAQGLTRVLEQPNEVAAWFVPPANAAARSQVNAGGMSPRGCLLIYGLPSEPCWRARGCGAAKRAGHSPNSRDCKRKTHSRTGMCLRCTTSP